MKIHVTEEELPFFEALASDVRIKIIKRLALGDANVKELAGYMNLSSAMMTSHVRKLEEAGIIKTHMSKRSGKVCKLMVYAYDIQLPLRDFSSEKTFEIELPVGHFTRADVKPTCGLANAEKVIGKFDQPRCFFDIERVSAQLLWFAKGFVEYTVANCVRENQVLKCIEISAELGSEAPHTNDNWPSDITLYFNNHEICTWTSPADYGDKHGKLTPTWWGANQYGFLKVFTINESGVFLDGEKKSNLTLNDFEIEKEQWTLKFEVSEDKPHVGGLTIYGKEFGNYEQNILIRATCMSTEGNPTADK